MGDTPSSRFRKMVAGENPLQIPGMRGDVLDKIQTRDELYSVHKDDAYERQIDQLLKKANLE